MVSFERIGMNALVLWRQAWEQRWPDGIMRVTHLQHHELERLHRTLGHEEFEARLAKYLAKDTDWLVQHKHPVSIFLRDINSFETQPGDTPDGFSAEDNRLYARYLARVGKHKDGVCPHTVQCEYYEDCKRLIVDRIRGAMRRERLAK